MRRKAIILYFFAVAIFLTNYVLELFPSNIRNYNKCMEDIVLLCYNVKSSDSSYYVNQRIVAETILQAHPDVVFLCEFDLYSSCSLDSVFKAASFKRYYRSGSNCIFYSKYEIKSLFSIDTGTSKGRFALNNIIHVYTPNGPITIVGCHLSSSRKDIWGGYINRKMEADSIYNVCMKEKRPLIVMGDLNDLSCSPPVKIIEKAGLKDAWWEGGFGYGATYHDGLLRLRIDHILYDSKELELAEVKVIDNDLSDHNALLASFNIKKKHLKH